MRPQGQAEPKGGPPRRNGWTWLEQRLLSNGGLGPKSGQAKPPGQAGSWANASESGKIKGSPGMSFQHPFAGHFLVQMAKATTQDQRYIFKKKKKNNPFQDGTEYDWYTSPSSVPTRDTCGPSLSSHLPRGGPGADSVEGAIGDRRQWAVETNETMRKTCSAPLAGHMIC